MASLWVLLAVVSWTLDAGLVQAEDVSSPLWARAFSPPRLLGSHPTADENQCDPSVVCQASPPPRTLSGSESKENCQNKEHRRRLSGDGLGDGQGVVRNEAMVLSVASLCLFFVAFNMGILHLVNCKAPSIRVISWEMVSTALCIYCAVLITETSDRTMVEQVLKGNFVDGPGLGVECVEDWHLLVTSMCQFLFYYSLLNVFCYVYSDSNKRLATYSSLGGHLVAFSGINFFSHLVNTVELSDDTALNHVAMTTLALVAFVVLMFITSSCRQWLMQSPQHDEHAGRWLHKVTEAEQEAVGLILGFLIMNGATAYARHGEPCGHHGCHRGQICQRKELILLAMISFGILFVLCAYIFARQKCGESSWRERCVLHLRVLLAMSMAWCFEALGEWILLFALPCLPMALSRLLSAALCTIFAFACVFLFYRGLDSFQEHFVRTRALVDVGEDLEVLIEKVTADGAKDFVVFHDTVLGFATLVGLSWERCLQPLISVITNSQILVLSEHRVRYTAIISVVLVVIVLPAWMYHILPMANKSYDEFAKEILQKQKTKSDMTSERSSKSPKTSHNEAS